MMSEQVKSTNNYRPDIDGLRAIAILAVIFFHAFPENVPGGFVGVDIFFVISGFLISSHIFQAITENKFSFHNFYFKRIKRIFPALLVVIAFCLIFGWLALFNEEYKLLLKHIIGGSVFVSNFILWRESGYFDKLADLKPLLHFWSLSIEEQFYIFFPLLVFFLFKIGKKKIISYSIPILILFSFMYCQFLLIGNTTASFYSTPSRIWELLIGSYLAYFKVLSRQEQCLINTKKIIIQNTKSIVGFILICAPIILYNKNIPYPGWRALLPTVGTFLIISTDNDCWLNKKILSNPLLTFIGLISYPLYLWHWPLLSFARIVNSNLLTGTQIIFCLALSFLLSYLTYKFIETPIRLSQKLKQLSLILSSMMFLILLCCSFLYKYPHFLQRHNIAKIENEYKNYNPPKPHYPFDNETCLHLKPFEKIANCFRQNLHRPATIAIIGDSHAEQYFWSLSRELQLTSENVVLISGGGCPPFINLESSQIGIEDHCQSLMGLIIKYIVQNKKIHTVLMTDRGPLYFTGKGFNEPEHNRYIKNTSIITPGNFQNDYSLAFLETLKILDYANKKIIYAIDTPELGFSPTLCLNPRPFAFTNTRLQNCGVAKIEYDRRALVYRESVFESTKKYPKVKIFDPSLYLCDNEICRASIGQKLLYQDDDHLNLEGSAFLNQYLLKLIKI